MRNQINKLLSLLTPKADAKPDAAPRRAAARVIAGGAAFPELCQLAVDWPVDEAIAFSGYRLNQLKADGIRAVYIDGRIVTREGMPLDCAMHCQPGLRRLEESYGHAMVFDGEYVALDGFNATLGELKAGKGEGVFWVFDALPHGAWILGGTEISVEERLGSLKRRIDRDAAQSLFVGMLDYRIQTADETRNWTREIWAAGYEGIVSKRLGSGYARRRTDDWRRLKEKHTHDGRVIDIAVKDGKLRKVTVAGAAGYPPIVVSTGWTLDEAAEIMARDAKGVPQMVEVEFQLTTGLKRSVRGARFNRLRSDRA
jgi:hypothetical protein